ncbi:hypothetical protein MMC21_007848 [Puttea exsequens]|nr:hypothetical protein [Puttea exsequens]
MQFKHYKQTDEIQGELMASEHLGKRPGRWCNVDGETKLSHAYPQEIFLFMELGISFAYHLWSTDLAMTWTARRTLCKDLLLGLKAIHDPGWMHQDITSRNVLILKHPLRAALCDFGKLKRDSKSRETALATSEYLPPEVEEGKANEYNQKLDIWELGITLFRIWFPAAWSDGRDLRDKDDRNEVLKILLNPEERAAHQVGDPAVEAIG